MTIKTKLISSSILFIIMAAILMWIGFFINKERQNSLTFINYAGQLRFRVYRMAWLVHEYRTHAANRVELEADIRKDIEEFKSILFALRHGSDRYNIIKIADNEILSRLDKHIEDWNEVKPMMEHILKMPDFKLHDEHEEQIEDYVKEIHATVNFFESKEKTKMRTSMFKIYLVAVFSMSLFFTFLFFVYRQFAIPLGFMAKNMKEFSNGNFHIRIDADSKDEVGQVVSTFNNMAERIEAMHEKLASAIDESADTNYKLENMNRLRSRMLPIAAHELKTPLAAIKAGIHTLLRKDARFSEDDIRRYLSIINSETDHIAELINEILDFTRIEINRMELNLMPASISDIIMNASGKLNINNLELDLQENITKIWLDTNKIKQVVSNLIDNAVKYSPNKGKIKISAKDEGNFIEVTVDDEGIGIPEPDKEKVFDAFYRTNSDLSKSTHGLGLGLFICKGIIEAHKGKIWIEEKEGSGTRVAFTLPKERENDLQRSNTYN